MQQILRRLSRSLRRRTRPGGFDEAFYLARYPDVAASGMDPAEHFLKHGWREGRDPCRFFSVSGYLAANPDVREAGVNPLLHFWASGLAEGRTGWQTGSASAAAPPPALPLSPVSASPLAQLTDRPAGRRPR